jgi:hypothetical protein
LVRVYIFHPFYWAGDGKVGAILPLSWAYFNAIELATNVKSKLNINSLV